MVHAIVRVTVFTFLTAGACAEVDFTPKESFYLAETTRIPCVAFKNGRDEMSYTPPHGWTTSGGGRKLTLIPPDKVQAGATMQTQPAKDPLPATEDNLQAYAELAVKQLPREATKVTVVESVICPLRIAKWTMAEVTLTYVLFGQQFSTNILFLPHEKEQIIFQLTARNADYPELARAFRASLYTLQGL